MNANTKSRFPFAFICGFSTRIFRIEIDFDGFKVMAFTEEFLNGYLKLILEISSADAMNHSSD